MREAKCEKKRRLWQFASICFGMKTQKEKKLQFIFKNVFAKHQCFAIRIYLSIVYLIYNWKINSKKNIGLSLNDCNTINLWFLRLIFEFTPFLFCTAENLRWPKVLFTTEIFLRKIQKIGVNWKTGGKVWCLVYYDTLW